MELRNWAARWWLPWGALHLLLLLGEITLVLSGRTTEDVSPLEEGDAMLNAIPLIDEAMLESGGRVREAFVPPYSFTFRGYYKMYVADPDDQEPNGNDAETSDNATTTTTTTTTRTASPTPERSQRSHGWMLRDQGDAFMILLTRPSAVSTVKTAALQVSLRSSQSEETHGRYSSVFRLAGFQFGDVKLLNLHGETHYARLPIHTAALKRPARLGTSRHPSHGLGANATQGSRALPSWASRRCNLMSGLHFDKRPADSLSIRLLETNQNPGPFGMEENDRGGPWEFDESLFGATGGEWRRRRLSESATSVDTVEGTTAPGGVKQPLSSASANDRVDPVNVRTPLPPAGIEMISRPKSSSPFQDLTGVIVSPDCGIRIELFSSELDLLRLGARVLHFSFLVILKNLLELHCLLAQIKHSEGTVSSPLKVSFISLGLHVAVDCLESILLFKEAISATFMASSFVVLTIFKMLFLCTVELRYMVMILKARYSDAEGSPDLTSFFKLHASCTALLIVFTLKMMTVSPAFIALLFFFWIPQIVFDAWRGHRRSLSVRYILGMSFCRLLLPLYFWGCPDSVFNGDLFKSVPGAPSAFVCFLLTALIGVQVILMMIQRFYGPRSFVPACLLPNSYNYYRPIAKLDDIEMQANGERGYECVICMTDISYLQKTMVTTPCDHHFHEKCLEQWMEIKAECPTCRGPLPPFS